MKKNIQKITRGFIFILLLLLLISGLLPVLLLNNYIFTVSETSRLLVKSIATQYWYIYIFFVIAVFATLLFFRKFFPEDCEEVKKIADKQFYDESNLKSEVPMSVWLPIVVVIIIMLLIGWMAVK